MASHLYYSSSVKMRPSTRMRRKSVAPLGRVGNRKFMESPFYNEFNPTSAKAGNWLK